MARWSHTKSPEPVTEPNPNSSPLNGKAVDVVAVPDTSLARTPEPAALAVVKALLAAGANLRTKTSTAGRLCTKRRSAGIHGWQGRCWTLVLT